MQIVDVARRDGMQNDPAVFSAATKVEMIARPVVAGVARLEVVSFVNPKRVPQMADDEELMAALLRIEGVSSIDSVMSRWGLDRAIAVGVDEINAVGVCSDTFCERNQGMTTVEALEHPVPGLLSKSGGLPSGFESELAARAAD